MTAFIAGKIYSCPGLLQWKKSHGEWLGPSWFTVARLGGGGRSPSWWTVAHPGRR